MGEEIPVFDDWGNEVGKFIPTGSGCGDAILGTIVVFLVGALVSAFVAVINMMIKGFTAVGEKEWEKAVAYLTVPISIAALFICLVVGGIAQGAAEQGEREQHDLAVSKDLAWAAAHQDSLVTITRVAGAEIGFEGGSLRERWLQVEYQITNDFSATPVDVSVPVDAPYTICQEKSFVIRAGETATIHCGEYLWDRPLWSHGHWVRYSPCLRIIVNRWSSDSIKGEYCLEDLVPPEIGNAASLVEDLTLYLDQKSCDTSPCSGDQRLHARVTTSSLLNEGPLGFRFFFDQKEREGPLILEEGKNWPVFLLPDTTYTLYDNWIGIKSVGKEYCLEVSFPYMKSGMICQKIPSP